MAAPERAASAWRPSSYVALAILGVAGIVAGVPGWQDDLPGWILVASPLLLFDLVRLWFGDDGAQAARIAVSLVLLWSTLPVLVTVHDAELLVDLRAEALAKPDDGGARVALRVVDTDPECRHVYLYDPDGQSRRPWWRQSAAWRQRVGIAAWPGASARWKPVIGSLYVFDDCH